MEKGLKIENDRVSALILDGLVTAGAKYTGNLPISGKILKNSFGRLVKDAENWEFIPVLKSFKVYENVAAGTALKVYKNHNYGINDTFYQGAVQFTVTAIDVTQDDYDVFTVASITATAEDILVMEENPATVYANSMDIVAVAEEVNFGDKIEAFIYPIANQVFDRYYLPFFLGDLADAIQIGSVMILPVNTDTVPGRYKELSGMLFQSGTDAPTAIIFVNELGAIPTYSYDSAGKYQIDSVGLFTLDKTFCMISNRQEVLISMFPKTEDYIQISSEVANTGVLTDGKLGYTSFLIRVYD